MNKRLVLFAALIAMLFAGCAKAQTSWLTDLDAAKATSQKAKKDLLIVFTGSDWNDPSKKLITDVFTADFFKKGSKDYVLCNIDIVQDKKLMDPAELEKNYTTATKYGAQALPFFILQTPEGDIYAASAGTDQTGTTDGLFAFLQSFQDARKKISDLKKKIISSKGVEKAKNIDTFVETIEPSHREQYADLIRQVPGLDADGKAGLKGKYQLQVAYLDAVTLYQAGKLTEAGDIFVKLAGGSTLNKGQSQEAWYMGAYMYAMSGNIDNAKVIGLLEKAIAADPENPGSAQIKATIKQIKSAPLSVANPVPAKK